MSEDKKQAPVSGLPSPESGSTPTFQDLKFEPMKVEFHPDFLKSSDDDIPPEALNQMVTLLRSGQVAVHEFDSGLSLIVHFGEVFQGASNGVDTYMATVRWPSGHDEEFHQQTQSDINFLMATMHRGKAIPPGKQVKN